MLLPLFYDKDLRIWRSLSPTSKRVVLAFIWAGGFSLLALVVVGCNGILPTQPTPFNPADFAPIAPPPPQPTPPPGPHFALEIQGSATATDREPWVGQVSVLANINIIRPEWPTRVVTTCGATTQAHVLGFGTARVSCLLPLGVHAIGAVAEMGDGRRYGTAMTVTVNRPVEPPLVVFFDLWDSVAGKGNTVVFSVRTVDRATRYHWDFGDGQIDTTMLSSVKHLFTKPSTGSNERLVTVRAMDGDTTLATGSVIGRW